MGNKFGFNQTSVSLHNILTMKLKGLHLILYEILNEMLVNSLQLSLLYFY